MAETFKAVQVTDNVYWVGAIDWDIRNFHGYATHRGSTYNAYLVMAEKVTLIDTVKGPFKNEFLSRISSVIDPGRIDYVVSNHSEMDHSGCLPGFIERFQPEKVFASKKGVEALDAHFGIGEKLLAVDDGERIDLGNNSLTCIETRMLHWPDSMVTYLSEGKILFSQDGFGMHLASTDRFDDRLEDYILEQEAAKYYANILLPFSPIVKRTLKKIDESGLDIDMIAPDHGPVWRSRKEKILLLYRRWSDRELRRKAVITCDSMWGSTTIMSRAIGQGLLESGVDISYLNLGSSDRSDLATELIDAGALVVGSPTINGNLFPTVADALYYIRGLKPTGIVGAAFGSYGWSGEAVGQITELLEQMKIELIGEKIRAKYVPGGDTLQRCGELGRAIGKRLESLPLEFPGKMEAR
ncbi:MAG: FprA family A-type flavoprotein [Candidatus Krumholzibacteriota bacterium]|nr:FprA family A-type flavoprotein [Candidatus Krumholzibacteriota bacterium]